jgi:hypothetical protein
MSAKAKTDTKNRFVIIMAGGHGGCFWPVNCEKRAFDQVPAVW